MNKSLVSSVVLEARGIVKTFDSNLILNDLDLILKQGEIVSLIGPSGCGKTTLIRILSDVIQSDSGLVQYLNDQTRLPCAVAFQDSTLFPWLTVLENIKICIDSFYFSEKQKDQQAKKYLSKVSLSEFANYYPLELSGGIIQRVNVARVFASDAKVIFMDEPFVHLDFIQKIALQKLTLDIFNKEGKTILFITHNISEAISLSDRILLMSANPGSIIQEFNVDINRPRNLNSIREDPAFLTILKQIMNQLEQEYRKNQEFLEKRIKKTH